MRGRKPIPRVIQIARGDPGKRAKRRLREEFDPTTNTPLRCPRWLTPDARVEWRRVMHEYGNVQAGGSRFLTAADQAALAAYCQAWADLKKATEELAKHGETQEVVSKAGEARLIANPWVRIRATAYATLAKYLAMFGFNPSDRTRVKIEKTDAGPRDEVAEILG